MKLYELDEMIRQVCPIHGISIGGDSPNISFQDEATEEQKALAHEIYDAHYLEVQI